MADDRLKNPGWVHKHINGIVAGHYGRGVMAQQLTEYLAHRISREGLDRTWIRRTCWEWYHANGAGAANDVANEIVEALTES